MGLLYSSLSNRNALYVVIKIRGTYRVIGVLEAGIDIFLQITYIFSSNHGILRYKAYNKRSNKMKKKSCRNSENNMT